MQLTMELTFIDSDAEKIFNDYYSLQTDENRAQAKFTFLNLFDLEQFEIEVQYLKTLKESLLLSMKEAKQKGDQTAQSEQLHFFLDTILPNTERYSRGEAIVYLLQNN